MSACANCGNNQGYQEKDNCPACGYLKPVIAKLDEASLIFCSGCGCSYLIIINEYPCAHDKSMWQKVKL